MYSAEVEVYVNDVMYMYSAEVKVYVNEVMYMYLSMSQSNQCKPINTMD